MTHEPNSNAPECEDQEREAKRVRSRITDAVKLLHKKELERAFRRSPKKMTISDKSRWRNIAAIKSDGFGGRLIRLTERFGRLVEGCVVNGETMEECVGKMWHIANYEGLPDSVFGDVVFMLSKVLWIHSKELHDWYNKPPAHTKSEAKKKKEKEDKHYKLFRPILE